MSNNINNNIFIFKNYLVDQIPEAENFQPSSIQEITKIITKLKQSNSVGWDNIPTTILKSNINILAPILSNLINKPLSMGLFPKSLKRAKILPIFKNKDKLDITNYRPISILPVIRRKLQLQHSWISVKRLTVWIIIFYYLNSNDMASKKLHCNG